MKRPLKKPPLQAKVPLLVFVQVKPKKPMPGWPMAAGDGEPARSAEAGLAMSGPR